MGRAEWSPGRTWTICEETQETLVCLGTVRWTVVVWGSTKQPSQHIQTTGKRLVSGLFRGASSVGCYRDEGRCKKFCWDLPERVFGDHLPFLPSLGRRRDWVPSYCLVSCPVNGQYRWLIFRR